MKKLYILFILALVTFSSCNKENFFDKFVPEVLYYEKDKVENADFKEKTLTGGASEWTIKARVSAPMKLKEIKLLKVSANKNEELLESYSDFHLSPNVYMLQYVLEKISTETIIRIVATDVDNKSTTRDFTIKVVQ